MTNVIKIVKQGGHDAPKESGEKTTRQATRELIKTIKSWVSETEARRRLQERNLSHFHK